MRKLIDITGQKFGMLTVVQYVGQKKWLCLCDCGTTHYAAGSNLRRGDTISCGCLSHRYGAESGLYKHGMRGVPEYPIWQSMKRRCYNTANAEYHNYGGRGISVCDRWLHDFGAFYSDMGPRPPKHQIDRIDTNGNYSPDNCRWVTSKEQNRNKRNNRRIEVDGITATLAEWSEVSGICQSTLSRRLSSGWSTREAVYTPPQRLSA